jgi:hypothetical protein
MNTTNEHLATMRYPTDYRLRKEYIRALEECKSNPAYYIILPTGDHWSCSSVPFMEDDIKGWTKVKRKIHVKKVLSEEELEYLAAQMNENWESTSVDSRGGLMNPMTGPVGEHNGALFDIGSRF